MKPDKKLNHPTCFCKVRLGLGSLEPRIHQEVPQVAGDVDRQVPGGAAMELVSGGKPPGPTVHGDEGHCEQQVSSGRKRPKNLGPPRSLQKKDNSKHKM